MKRHRVCASGFASLVVLSAAAMPAWAGDTDNAREMQITYQLNDSQIGPAESDRTDTGRRAGTREPDASSAQDKKTSAPVAADPKRPRQPPITQ